MGDIQAPGASRRSETGRPARGPWFHPPKGPGSEFWAPYASPLCPSGRGRSPVAKDPPFTLAADRGRDLKPPNPERTAWELRSPVSRLMPEAGPLPCHRGDPVQACCRHPSPATFCPARPGPGSGLPALQLRRCCSHIPPACLEMARAHWCQLATVPRVLGDGPVVAPVTEDYGAGPDPHGRPKQRASSQGITWRR